ncbi:uncharacterized protein LOC121410223 isoform X1 [Lytechinus variegatus]|uniref:uncharacterized protein LOC121410223 isoform X1 n=1 Tax=Lytechinus variegatus TaxID=7654 RepID=UPI001BB28900|nr:uncharacterized protein LOC121410223 isoform X1 [Lytechinus variegatus]
MVVSQPTDGFQIHGKNGEPRNPRLQDKPTKPKSRDSPSSKVSRQFEGDRTVVSQDCPSLKKSDNNSTGLAACDKDLDISQKFHALDSSQKGEVCSTDNIAQGVSGHVRNVRNNVQNPGKSWPVVEESTKQTSPQQPRSLDISPVFKDIPRKFGSVKQPEHDLVHESIHSQIASNVVSRRTDILSRDENVGFVPVATARENPSRTRLRKESPDSNPRPSRTEVVIKEETKVTGRESEKQSPHLKQSIALSSNKSQEKPYISSHVKKEGSLDEVEMMRQLLAMAESNASSENTEEKTKESGRAIGSTKTETRDTERTNIEEDLTDKKPRPIFTLTADRGSPVSTFVLMSSKESLNSNVGKDEPQSSTLSHLSNTTRSMVDKSDTTMYNPHHIDADEMAEEEARLAEGKPMGEAVTKMLRLKRGKSEETPPRQGSLDDSHYKLIKRQETVPSEYESLSDSEIRNDQDRRGRKTLLGDRPKQNSEDLSDLPGLTDLGAIGGGDDERHSIWPPNTDGAESKYISVEDLTKVGLGRRMPAIGQKHSNNGVRTKRQKPAGDMPLSPIFDVEGGSPSSELGGDPLSSECTSLADDSEEDINRDYYEDQDYMTEDRSYSSFDSGDDYTDYMEDVIMEDISMEHEVVEHLSPYRIKEEGLATVMEEQEDIDEYYLDEEEEEEEEEEAEESEEEEPKLEPDRTTILSTIQEQTSEETQESPDYMSPCKDELSARDGLPSAPDLSDLSTDQTFESLSSVLTREHIAPVAATVEKEIVDQAPYRPSLDIDLTPNTKRDNSGVLDSPRTPTVDSRAYERPKITSPSKRFDMSSPRTSPISPNLFSPPLTPKSWAAKRTFPETMFPMEHSTQVEAEVDTHAPNDDRRKYRSVLTEMGSSFEELASITWPETISEGIPSSGRKSFKSPLFVETGSTISPEDSTSTSENTVIACDNLISTSAQTQTMVERRTQTTPPPLREHTKIRSKSFSDAAVGPGNESPESNSSSPSKSVHTTSIGVGTSPEMSPTSSTHSTDTDFSFKRPFALDETKHPMASNASSSGSSSPEPSGGAKRNPRTSRKDTGSLSSTHDTIAAIKNIGQFTGKDYLKASSSDAESCDSESSTPAKVRRRLPAVPLNVQPVTVSLKPDLRTTIDEILRDPEKSIEVKKVKELLARKAAELEKERREALLKLRKLTSDSKRLEEGKERLSRRYNKHHKVRVAGVNEGSLSDSDVTITSEDKETEELAALLHPLYGIYNPFPTGNLSISSDRIHEIETSDLPSSMMMSQGDQIRLSKSEEDILREIEKQISEATGTDYKAYNTSQIEKEVRSRYSDIKDDSRSKKDNKRRTPLQEKFTTSEIPDYGLKTVRHKMKEELKQVTAHRRAQLDNSPPSPSQAPSEIQTSVVSPERQEGEQKEGNNGSKSSSAVKTGKSGSGLPVRGSQQASPQRRKARWQPTDSVAPAFSPIKEDVDSEFDFLHQNISDRRTGGMTDKRSLSYDSSSKTKKGSSNNSRGKESSNATSDDVERLSKEGELIERKIREQTEKQFRQELDRRRRQMEESARKLEELKTRRQSDWSSSGSTTSEPVISASHSLETLKAAYEADSSANESVRYEGQEPVTYPRTKLKRGSPFHYSSPQLTDRERGIRRDQQGLILPITDGHRERDGGVSESMSDSGIPSRQGSINRGERPPRPRMMSRESSLDSTNSEMRLFSDQDENVLYDDTVTPEKATEFRRPEPPPCPPRVHENHRARSQDRETHRSHPHDRDPQRSHSHDRDTRRGTTDEEWDSSEGGQQPQTSRSSRQSRPIDVPHDQRVKRHPEDYYYSDQEIRVKATEWSRRAEDSDDNEVDRRLRAQYHDEQFRYHHGPQQPRGGEPSPQASVGRKYRLQRDPRDRTNRGNGLGMRVVGGKRMPGSDQLVAYVAEIHTGGVAERTEGLREGDQVLEWCGISLTGRTYEEVQRIVKSSEKQTEVLLKCGPNLLDSPRPRARLPNGEPPPPPPPPPPGGYRRNEYGGGVDPRMLTERLEGITYPSYGPSSVSPSDSSYSSHRRGRGRKVTGEIQLQVAYDNHRAELLVGILRGRGLTARDSTNLADPYVSVCLLPARGSPEDRQRSRYVPRTLTPEWNQSIIFRNLRHSQIRSRTIEVNVWDYDRSSTSEFMGQVILDLSDERLLTNRPRWYRLMDVPMQGSQQPGNSSVMTPPSSSPGNRQGNRRSHHDQRSSDGRGDSRSRRSSGDRNFDPRSGGGSHMGGRTGSRGDINNGDRGRDVRSSNGYDRPPRYTGHHHHHPESDSPSSRSSGYEYDTDRSSQSDRSISSTQEHHRSKKLDSNQPQTRSHVHFSRTHENDRYKRDMNSLPETIPEAPSIETPPPTTTVSTSVKITVTAKPMCSLAGQRASSMQSVVNGNGRVVTSLSDSNGIATKTSFEQRPVIRVDECTEGKTERETEHQEAGSRVPPLSIFNYTSTDPASRAQGSQLSKSGPIPSQDQIGKNQREAIIHGDPRQTNSLKLAPMKNGTSSTHYRSTGNIQEMTRSLPTSSKRAESVAEIGNTDGPDIAEKNLQNHKKMSEVDRYSPWIEKQKSPPSHQSLIENAQELPMKSQMKATLVTRLARGDLGPGQVVDPEMPRQVDLILLRGEYEISGEMKIGFRRELKTEGQNLYVQIFQCRKIRHKGKPMDHPDLYVKAYVVMGERKVTKKKTRVCRQEKDPTFNEVFVYHTNVKGIAIEVSLWAAGGRFGRNTLIGEALIWLDDLKLDQSEVVGWYKLLLSTSAPS